MLSFQCGIVNYIIFLTLCLVCNGELKKAGDQCVITDNILNGTCIGIRNCKSVQVHRIRLSFCNPDFKSNFNALVCCDHKSKQKEDSEDRRQRISLQMCQQYYPEFYEQAALVKKDETDTGHMIPYNSFGENGPTVTNGVKSLGQEFPHMALIGNGDEGNISWYCGGALISKKFVLTAAHCIKTDKGEPQWIRLGELDLASTMDDADPRDFKINRTVAHPNYEHPSHYHDIGLLQLDSEVTFTDFIKPACLAQYNTSSVMFALVTGWGAIEYGGIASSHLMQASLEMVNNTRCRELFKTTSLLKLSEGIVDSTQICAGGNDGKDSCQGDSGGPLQVRRAESIRFGEKVYDLIGVTSFGTGCGTPGRPGVYTRIAFYLDWIENIVWPQ